MTVTTDTLRYVGETYTLAIAPDRPFVVVEADDGRRLVELFVLSSVHRLGELDDTTAVGDWHVERHPGGTSISLTATSSAWEAKTYTFRCSPRRFTYDVKVTGHGSIWEALYFGGHSSAYPRWGAGFFLSGQDFDLGFNPEPNSADVNYFDPAAGATIDLSGAPLPGKRHWFFTPGPFCFAFRADPVWLTMGVECAPGGNRFSEFRYRAGDGFYLSLSYDGHTEVDGTYVLPSIGFDFAQDEFGALTAHAEALRASAAAPTRRQPKPAWWYRPIFCGWGAQCAMAAADYGYEPDGSEVNPAAFLATMRYAPDYSRQEAYDGFLQIFRKHEIHPGTVVLDDKWQKTYGNNEVDVLKWPDLPAFVAARHDEEQRVLLWLKAWDREGVPDDECITNGAGLPLTVDPTNPRYLARLRNSVRLMLGSDGIDADGFKVDFTHRIPASPSCSTWGNSWGLELMRAYLAAVYEEAKRIKPDALIVTHTPHPYLAGALDMIRLNDMLDLTQLDDPAEGRSVERTVRLRALIARLACPDALIDTDNWPVRDRASWREYIALQPSVGVPSLYFAATIDLTQEPLTTSDYELLREAWTCSAPR